MLKSNKRISRTVVLHAENRACRFREVISGVVVYSGRPSGLFYTKWQFNSENGTRGS
jgi:hypothetical protein